MSGVEVPVEAEEFIALHRTHLDGNLPILYARDVARDFDELKPYLPERADAALDIGCGVAGIDVLLWRHFGGPVLHLMDGTGMAATKTGMNPSMEPYNSMAVARKLLEMNGVPAEDVAEWPIDPQAAVPPCDVVISLLSWGFHYPTETYLELAARVLRPGGRLVLDVRKNHGLAALLERFSLVAVVRDTPKFERVCLEGAR